MKRIFRNIFFICFLVVIISVVIYMIPRNNTCETFHKLNYGDSFAFTMLKLGMPTNISEGGNGTIFCKYELEDDSSVYVSFNNKLLYLNGAEQVKENKTLFKYVIKKDNLKTKILSSMENSFIGDFVLVIKNILVNILL